MKYDIVIFDWDGTLMDSTGRIVSSMQEAAVQTGLARPESNKVKQIIGLSMREAVTQVFGELDASQYDLLTEHYKANYISRDTTPTPMFDGAMATLQNLSQVGKTLAVATGKARAGLNRVWKASNTGHFFQYSCCADEANSKPHPQMLEKILHAANIPASKALMVGDTSYDMQMADSAGMDAIGVSFGAHDVEQLRAHSPIAVVDKLPQLLELV